MTTALKITTPTMTGRSTTRMASQTSRPSPGQPKTLSTTTTPPMNTPMSRPIMLMIGGAALRRAWRTTTREADKPLGAGGADIIAGQHVQQAGANHPRVPARAAQTEGQGRQKQVRQAAVAAQRKQIQPVGQQVHQAQAQPELRRGSAQKGEAHHQSVGPFARAAAPPRCPAASRASSSRAMAPSISWVVGQMREASKLRTLDCCL